MENNSLAYIDTLHERAEELAERAKAVEKAGDRDGASELRAEATRLVRRAALVRAMEADDDD